MVFIIILIIFSVLFFTFPGFFSKGLDYMTEENENYIFIGLLILVLLFKYSISFIKEKFFMNDNQFNVEIKKISKLQCWLQIILGVLVLAICLIFIFISIMFIIVSLDTATSTTQVLLTAIFGGIVLLGSLWFTNMTIRYILNKPRTKTLDEKLPPWALYFMSLYFIAMPIISIITGAFFEDLVHNLILLPIFIGAGIQTYQYAKFKAFEKNKK